MQTSKWWKCDLQIATPAWDFKLPPGTDLDPLSESDRQKFANVYMSAVKAAGIEVVALASHNSSAWIDEMKAAGQRCGIVVFPGVEITTGSGSDGIHLLVIGGRNKTAADFGGLLAGPIGFGEKYPPFRDGQPASSPRTVMQILDDLPADYLVIAPHALGENGIASGNTSNGDIRWRALHHERLNAVDAGDCSKNSGSIESFNARFRYRSLSAFPCLQHLAEERCELIREQIDLLNGLYRSAMGKNYINPPKEKAAAPATGGERQRRSRADLEAQAREVVEFIRTSGKDGVGGSEIVSRFGKLMPSVKQFVEKYSPDTKLKTTGDRRSTVYSV